MALKAFNTKVAQGCALKVKREMGPAIMRRVNSRKVQDDVATGHWVDHKGQKQTKCKGIGALVELMGRHLSPAGANSKEANRTCMCVIILLGDVFPVCILPDVTDTDVLHSSPVSPNNCDDVT